MICAQDLYGEEYRFMEYVACRSEQLGSGNFETCIPEWMNKNRLNRCAQGNRGRVLLEKSMKAAAELGVEGSPTWLLNNRAFMDGRTAEVIVRGFCELNVREACDDTVAPELGHSGEATPDEACR